MKTAFFFNRAARQHDNGARHPERPTRIDAIELAMREGGLWDTIDHREWQPASDQDLLRCHTPHLVETVRSMAQSGGGSFDSDTKVSPASNDVARLGAGAAMAAVDAVLSGEYDNAFVAMRPPGHHATPDTAMGFCLFNNVAVTARHAQTRGIERVAILDFDVHHGNGTQDIFYEDASVFFCSLHQSPLYPGTGAPSETGRGEGIGATLNIPLEAGSALPEYKVAWEKAGAAVKLFRPQLILISCGFDAHARDPLGGMNLSDADFAHLVRDAKSWAAELCEDRLVCVLEGGYALKALGESTVAVIKELQRDE